MNKLFGRCSQYVVDANITTSHMYMYNMYHTIVYASVKKRAVNKNQVSYMEIEIPFPLIQQLWGHHPQALMNKTICI